MVILSLWEFEPVYTGSNSQLDDYFLILILAGCLAIGITSFCDIPRSILLDAGSDINGNLFSHPVVRC
jgi:hypothetical protein